ncbi:MAG: nuclear transport factor 2 family protein [Acidobacteria bacterium]|nr:nuclear transport factor 2 family protein [Acidobacteriota bacterium]
MATKDAAPASVSEYISAFPPEVRKILERIRQTVRAAVPEAEEVISYRMPAFRLGGILLYFAAFRSHIGVFPPFSGDARLEKELGPWAGPKGNLRFPLDHPIPYDLIERIATVRARQNAAKAASKTSSTRRSPQGARSKRVPASPRAMGVRPGQTPATVNEATIGRYLEGFRRGDKAAVLACLTEDAEWEVPGAFEARGKAGFAEHFIEPCFAGLPEITVTRHLEANNVVVAEGTVTTHMKDGSVVRLAYCDVFELRDGLICRLKSYLVTLG